MLSLGVCGMVVSLYGGYDALRGIECSWWLKLFGWLSLCSAFLAGFVGWLCSFESEKLSGFRLAE
jgi:hypothetical protein